MQKNALILPLILMTLMLSACRNSGNNSALTEAHYMEYRITYAEDMAGDIPTRMLPKVMESWYTEQYVLTSITGFFNQFSLVQISNLRSKKVTTILNFFGTKVWYRSERGELPASVVDPGIVDIHITGDTLSINGILSYAAKVQTSEEEYDIYYNRNFKVRNPNLSTPYRDVGHPLSDFQIQLSYLKMQLTCTEYGIREVERELFRVPEDYREVERELMEQIINSLFTKE